jgi:trigger factor
LKIDKEELEDRRVRLTVEVPGDRLETAMHAAARQLGNRTRIPGFRPGKAPYKMIVQRLGEETVFEEALEALGQEIYRQVLEEAELDPYAPGSLDEVISRSPLTLRYTVPLQPEVRLGDYKAIRLPFEEPEVQDEAVDLTVDQLRQRQAKIEHVDRALQSSDVAVLDVHGRLREPKEGEEALLDEHGVSVLMAEGTDWPIPGIAGHLLGVQAGAEKVIEYTFPEDYRNESLRGRSAEFRVKVNEVKSRSVPDLTDELARSMGDFADVMDLKLKVRKSLIEDAKRQSQSDYAQAVVGAVAAGATVSYPPQVLEEELRGVLEDLDRRLKAERLSLADYLKIEKKTEEELKKELEPKAVERVRRALVLSQVVEEEDLSVEDQEITATLDSFVAPLKERAEEVRKAIDTPAGRRKIAVDILTDKAIARLVAIARGEGEASETAPAQNVQAEPTASGNTTQE